MKRRLRHLSGWAAALLLGACASQPPAPMPPAAPLPSAAPAPPSLDASYDWHVLLVVPFGTLYRDTPDLKDEMLVFDEQVQGAAGEHAECYTMNGAGPRFMMATLQELLLCYRHDHLSRIEATVMLPAAEAARQLAGACELWKKSASASAGSAAPDAEAQACRGREGDIDFDGRLERNSDLEADRAFLPFTVTLDARDPP